MGLQCIYTGIPDMLVTPDMLVEIFAGTKFSSKVLRADGRLVNMSGVFCTNNAQAPSLFSNVTLTSRRTKLIVC